MTGLRIKDNKAGACFNLRSVTGQNARVRVATSRNGTYVLEGMSKYMVRQKCLKAWPFQEIEDRATRKIQ